MFWQCDAPALCSPTISLSFIPPPTLPPPLPPAAVFSDRRNGPRDWTTSSHVQTSNVSPHPHCLPSTLTLSTPVDIPQISKAQLESGKESHFLSLPLHASERVQTQFTVVAFFWEFVERRSNVFACKLSYLFGTLKQMWRVASGPHRTAGITLTQVGSTSMLLMPRALTLSPPRSNVYQSLICFFVLFWGGFWLSLESVQESFTPWGRVCCSPPFPVIWVVFSVRHSGVSCNLSGRWKQRFQMSVLLAVLRLLFRVLSSGPSLRLAVAAL